MGIIRSSLSHSRHPDVVDMTQLKAPSATATEPAMQLLELRPLPPLPPPSAPAITRMHRDALHCVFAFVLLPERVRCAHVCRAWNDAASWGHPASTIVLKAKSPAQVQAVLNSRMRSHVGAIVDVMPSEHVLDDAASLWPQLSLIAVRLQQLQCLTVEVPIERMAEVALTLPPQLRMLVLTINLPSPLPLSDDNEAELTRFSEKLADHAPLPLSTLALIDLGNSRRLLVSPATLCALARIDSLVELHIDASWEDASVRAALRGKRQLRTLYYVEEGIFPWFASKIPWGAKALAQLTAGQLGIDYPALQSLGALGCVDDALLPLLQRLPSLTELEPVCIALPDVRPLLSLFPSLRSLRAEPTLVEDPAAWWGGLVAALPLCPQLTALTLSCEARALTDERLTAILRAAPPLLSLRVDEAWLTSLRCVAEAAQLHPSLQRLRLEKISGRIEPHELLHLRPLRALRELSVQCLSRGPSADLEAELRRQLKSCWPDFEHLELQFPRQQAADALE